MPHTQAASYFFEIVNRRSVDQMGLHLKENAQLHFPKSQPLTGTTRIVKFFQILFRRYPELSFDIQRVICQGNWAAVHWKNHGITRKNEPYANEGMTLFEFEDDKIVFISDFFKDTEKF